MPPAGPRLFISVAEQSADEHAAALIRAFTNRRPGASFAGLTGPALRAAGCETFHDMTTASAMALAAVRRIPEVVRLLYRLRATLDDQTFDAAVLVDSPALNLPIAGMCRRRNIPVFYYIAPQTWAWAAWRNRRIRRRVNRLACIWPFEEPYFRDQAIPATYVGHPSFERLLALNVSDQSVVEFRAGASPVITLLPGSREHVVREVLPGQLEVAEVLRKQFRRARFLVVPANPAVRRVIEPMVGASPAREVIHVLPDPNDRHIDRPPSDDRQTGRRPPDDRAERDWAADQRAAAIRAADLVLVASGTATLEVAYQGTPMIVMYNTGRWMYRLLGRWLISTKYLALPNILAGRRIVPEFMPYYRTTDPIIATALEWLATPATLARVRREITEGIRPIVQPGGADRAAAELAAMLDETK